MRNPRVVIVSDVHLGTYGSHAESFIDYLDKVNPEILILNGDIFDIWQFKKSYFPGAHFQAIQSIIDKVLMGVTVYYLTGNHDDLLRKFGEIKLDNFHIRNKLSLSMDGKKYWIFHGDVFDTSVNHSKWIARLGGKAYDVLIRINRWINVIRTKFNKAPLSFSKKIKANVKKAVKYVNDFEQTAIDIALENDYDFVVCGHIHRPIIKEYKQGDKKVTYMNSGDWVESLTALEYEDNEWKIYDYLKTQQEGEIRSAVNYKKLEIA